MSAQEGVLLSLANLNTTSIYLSDLLSGKSDPSYRVPGPSYIPPLQTIKLDYTSGVALSFEAGAIRGFIDAGYITASFSFGPLFETAITDLIPPIPPQEPVYTRRDYGTTPIVEEFLVVNLNESSFRNVAARASFKIWQNLETSYALSFFDITLNLNGNLDSVVKGLRFTTYAEVIAWCDANIPQVDGNWARGASLRCYDLIDPDLEGPNKIWGINSIFSRLKGFNKSYYGKVWTSTEEQNWDSSEAFLQLAWKSVFGISHPRPNAGEFKKGDYQAFWFGGSKANFYSSAYKSTVLDLHLLEAGYNNRYVIDTAGTDIPAPPEIYSFDTTSTIPILCVDQEGDSFEVLKTNSTPKQKITFIQAELSFGGWSSILAIGLISPTGGRAIQLKPVGQDAFYLPWINTADYRYEYIGIHDIGGQQTVYPMENKEGNAQSNYMGPWTLEDFQKGTRGTPSERLTGSKQPGKIQIQVRSLETGRVSKLSNACIYFPPMKRLIKIRPLVANPKA